MPTAYSYVRFSTPEQIKGDSIRRQVELSQKYAEAHGLTLDDSLQLNDLGVSAFKSVNAETGKLGLFISAIDSGAVKAGSYLLVESLDRLSRAEVMTALNQFTSILSKDILIVTLADNRVYTKDSINDIGNLMYSLMVMSRAHEESLTKSKRLSAAWENKRVKARDSGHKLTKTCPGWMELIKDDFQIIPDRVEVEYGDKRARLWSFEVKILLNRSNVRESWFQAVSNSSWANFGYLVASQIASDSIKELRILSAVHGIGVIRLDTDNPAESEILIPAKERIEIDWDTCNRLVDENKDFKSFVTLVRQFHQTSNLRPKDWDIPDL